MNAWKPACAAGRMNKRITIQQPAENPPQKSTDPGYTDVKTIWAAIEPLSVREFFAAEAVQSEVTHKVTMTDGAGITADMRVKYGGRYFEIKGPPLNKDEQGAEYTLMCKELGP